MRENAPRQVCDVENTKEVLTSCIVYPGDSPCDSSCSHLCLLRPAGFSCGCPDGMDFERGSNSTCIGRLIFLAYQWVTVRGFTKIILNWPSRTRCSICNFLWHARWPLLYAGLIFEVSHQKYSCESVINISVRQIDGAVADDVDSELTQRDGRGKKTDVWQVWQ